MRFTCGGRSFRLERNFARQAKSVSLVCENDGEELSVEHGDLEMLLGGMTAELFDNTVSSDSLSRNPDRNSLTHWRTMRQIITRQAAESMIWGRRSRYSATGRKKSVGNFVWKMMPARRSAGSFFRRADYLEADIRRLDVEYKEKESMLRALAASEQTGVREKKVRREESDSVSGNGRRGYGRRYLSACARVFCCWCVACGAGGNQDGSCRLQHF